MSTKSALLIALGIAVMAMGVYLFIQVRSTPAQANEPTVSTRPPPVTPTPTPTPTPPAPTPSARPAPIQTSSPAPTAPADDTRVNVKLDEMMQQASKAYDKQDFEEATAIAGKILMKDPANVKMLRIMVSSNCIQGDAAVAQQYYDKLPKFDREQMRTRCDRYGVTFKEPAQ